MALSDSIDRLKSQLLVSGLQQKNSALFQVINQLIGINSDLAARLEELAPSSGGGSSITTGQTFLTLTNEQVTLPNSRRLVPNSGVTMMTNGDRTFIGSSPLPIMEEPDIIEGMMGPPGPIGLRGLTGLPGPLLPTGEDIESTESLFPFGDVKELVPWQDYAVTSDSGITALGNGSLTGQFTLINKTVVYWSKLTVGATTTFSGAMIRMALPVICDTALFLPPAAVALFDTSTGFVTTGSVGLFTVTTAYGYHSDGTIITGVNPITMAAGDQYILRGFYRRQ